MAVSRVAVRRGEHLDERLEILQAISAEIVLSHYGDFASQSEQLTQAVTTLCDELTEEKFERAQEAWWETRARWKRVEVVTFGPAFAYPDRLGPRIDDWPVNRDAVEELLEDEPVINFDMLSQLGSAVRGLPVIEYLLWGGGGERGPLDRIAAESRRCDMLIAASRDVHANALQLESEWRSGWLIIVDESSADAPFKDEQEAIVNWVNRLWFTVENVRVEKFEKPLGDFSPEGFQPDLIESHPSGRSIEDARDALRGVKDIWRGSGEEGARNGLRFLVGDRRVVSQIDGLFDAAVGALGELSGSFERLTVDQSAELRRALEALKSLQAGIQSDLADATQSTVRFNSTTDGD